MGKTIPVHKTFFIGKEAGKNETGSDRLYIENSDVSTPLIYGEFDNDLVRVNGALEVTERTGTALSIAGFDSNGKLVESALSPNGTTTDLSVSGTTSPLTINSSTGSDITITGRIRYFFNRYRLQT